MDLSIVIPTLNEAAYIERTLQAIRRHQSFKHSLEIILIDAGSQDRTVELAQPWIDHLEVEPAWKGAKYKSLNAGAVMARGHALLFLDADSIVPNDFDDLLLKKLNHPDQVGGAFEFQTDGRGIGYRLGEKLNRLRYRIDQRYFGDQGLFCRKAVFELLGGFPEEPIMEAAFYCDRMKKLGSLALIDAPIVSSARRFEAGNKWLVFIQDTWIWLQFSLGMDVKRYASAYWQHNEMIEEE